MNREINFYVNDIDDIRIASDTFNGTLTALKRNRLFAGREGEGLATRLIFTFSSDLDTYTKSLVVDGTGVSLTALDDTWYYDLPSATMTAETVKVVVKAVLSTRTLLSKPIWLEVKR